MTKNLKLEESLSFFEFRKEILSDYKLLCISREMSIAGRKDVFSGKGKFGVFGDGKELAQIVLSKFIRKGDWRVGYYRDQTLMLALEIISPQHFFAQLYANTHLDEEPCSGGRQMNSHFASRFLDENGDFINQTQQYNCSSDISTTAGQMPRMVGLAQASKVYQQLPHLDKEGVFSKNGKEVVFASIGDASTSQGLFWEAVNAVGIMQLPIVLSIWDDGYGISVPREYHHTKSSIYECLQGFSNADGEKGIEILQVDGWNYTTLTYTYNKAEKIAREEGVPVIVHVKNLTQPLGHTTSGSHERYKSKERLDWEEAHDCLKKFEEWILEYSFLNSDGENEFLADQNTLDEIKSIAKLEVKTAKKTAWDNYQNTIQSFCDEAVSYLRILRNNSKNKTQIQNLVNGLQNKTRLYRKDVFEALRESLIVTLEESSEAKNIFVEWYTKSKAMYQNIYSSHLFSQSNSSYSKISSLAIEYPDQENLVDGRLVIRDNFDALLAKYPNLLIFGEDVGKIGDVNQGLEGLQDKYGEVRVFDTGIRESTIIGQGIGMAMRGLRPIAEIQYLDYVLYGLETISDDLASLHYRTAGGQKAPLIIRTRGHRLEGIWHSGSPMSGLLNLMRGILFLVPRNLTIAAGFYNTLLECDDPAIVVESLNGYRLKENLPTNLAEFKIQIGKVDITHTGNHVTIVTYGSTWKNVSRATEKLSRVGISAEVIDLQSLYPFDLDMDIQKSLAKTNRLVIVDEDVPGGASAYILKNILEDQDAYHLLDSKPKTITAKAHRPPYSSDGDYFTKPSDDDVFEGVYQLMHEAYPEMYPSLF